MYAHFLINDREANSLFGNRLPITLWKSPSPMSLSECQERRDLGGEVLKPDREKTHNIANRFCAPTIRFGFASASTPEWNLAVIIRKKIEGVTMPLHDTHSSAEGQEVENIRDLTTSTSDAMRAYRGMKIQSWLESAQSRWSADDMVVGENLIWLYDEAIEKGRGKSHIALLSKLKSRFIGAGFSFQGEVWHARLKG